MRRLKTLLLLLAVLPLCGFKFLSGLENENANKLYKKGQIGKAKTVYTKALKSDPSSPEVAYNLGNALFREEAFKESQANYQKSASEKSENRLFKAKAFYNLGNSQYRLKDLPAAAESYKKSLRLNPKDEDAKYNLELVLKQQQKDKKDQKKDPEKDKKKDQTQQKPNMPSKKDPQKQTEGQNKGDKDGGQGKEGDGDKGGEGEDKQDKPKPEPGQEQEKKGSQQGQDKQQSGEEKQDQEGKTQQAGKAEQEKPEEPGDKPQSEAQLRAEQILGALENQEQQVLKFQNSQNGPRSRVRRVAEQDW